MNKVLKDVAKYSEDRVSLDKITLETYVTTDNLLQNKQGKVIAEKLPPQGGSVTKFNNGDILIANIRPYLKKIWFATQSGGSSTDVLTLKVNDNYHSNFIYYTLFRDDFFKHMMNGSKGTKMPRGDKNHILDFPIPNFNFNIQKRIAKVLSDLDAKIELNNKINQELEAMAKTLYDYWFVQFDFPDENGKPYKSSGGKMVYNEELKREIPEGWEVTILGDIINRSGTGLNPRKNFKLGLGNNYYVTIKNIKQNKVVLDDRCDRIDNDALEIINKRSELNVGDILFTSIQPVGITYLIQEKPTNWDINESVFTIRPKDDIVSSEFLFMLLSSDEIKVFTKNVSAGSVHKGIRHTVLKTFKLPFGNKLFVENFTKCIKPILKKMFINEKENQQLTKLRDGLLPMLMNGQVTVG